ncbi:MAG TPA: ATP-binding protein [Candidatus Methylomirabilis sp.]|nr:ATP-binding protein [Candidatus Methylomirabilis sp.]
MRRLFLQVYLAFLGIVLALGLLIGSFLWWAGGPGWRHEGLFEGMASLLADALPDADRPRADLQAKVTQLAQRFQVDITVRSPDGTLLAAAGPALPAPPARLSGSGWFHAGRRPTAAFHLPDGRWVLARDHRSRLPGSFLLALALVAATVAAGAYPLARRIVGRLERLQARVEALGKGDLATRVDVEGADEVARLARSFNQAADRIQALMAAQKHLLASVSHELRTPLTRMRMAVELLPAEARPELRARLTRDISELDGLIGELLLASRLDALDPPIPTEEVDLLALLAEEAAETGAEVSGEPLTVRGDPRLLRRLVRNLLANARRHGDGSPVEATVHALPDGGARLRIADRGPGVPAAERERIFQPFYRLPGRPETGEGVGLGLALVRQIARRHSGEARCLPREGGGTVFEVELQRPDLPDTQ